MKKFFLKKIKIINLKILKKKTKSAKNIKNGAIYRLAIHGSNGFKS